MPAQLAQAPPQLLQASPTHGTFLGHALGALGQDIKLAIVLQELDLDRLAHRLPGPLEEGLLQAAEASLGGAHQIVDGGRGSAHPRQACLGGDAPVHHPGAIGFAVERLDLLQEVLQGGGVGGIAGQDLIGQRKALGGDDQGDHHLHAVRPLVAAVAEFALALLAPWLSPRRPAAGSRNRCWSRS